MRHCSFARPIQQHSHALGIARRRVCVQQQHRLGLQTLGAVNGQEPHRVCTDSGRRQNTTGPECPHQGIGGGVTPAVDLQRNRQQRTQICQHGIALCRRCSGGKTGQYIAVVIQSLQRIMRRQAVQPKAPARQLRGHALQTVRIACAQFIDGLAGIGLQQVVPSLREPALGQRQLYQRRIGDAKQWRSQHPRQRQIVLRRHQHVEQCGDVLYFTAINQGGFFADLGRNAEHAKLLLKWQQTSPLARQHHHLSWFE